MKISIITPSFNQGQFIEETIKSVLHQNYPDLEYIVIDGGSTDNTIGILKKYRNKIRWISEKDEGQTDAINKGIRMATGDIIAYINSDDYYSEGALENVARFFTNTPGAKWVTGDYFIINEKGKKIQSYIRSYKKLLRRLPFYPMLSFANFIAQPSTFLKKEVINRVGLFNKSLHYAMDYEYWLRVLRNYPLCVLNEPLSSFRIHKLSKGGSQFKKQLEEEYRVIKKFNKNIILLWFHYIHNKIVECFYNVIKK